jgi:hypothetical protein
MSAAVQILQRTWKHIKTFTWRALATGERAGHYSAHIVKHCCDCERLENDAYPIFG